MVSENRKDLELKKHVGSIHCSNTLSLLQRKISNVLLYHAYDELLEKDEHEIAIKTLCTLIGYSSHDYDSIKKALKALISTVLEWNLLGDTKGNGIEDWNASSILSSVGIKGGICTYSYSTRLKKLLYMPEIYGRINIAIQARFKSNYALALYENCIRYKNLPYTRWFELVTFRKLMGVPGEKYSIFRDFKRRVVDKSVTEINAFSDINVEPEIEREGQRVHRIRFKINQQGIKQPISQPQSEISGEGRTLIAELTQLGISSNQAEQLLKEYDPGFIEEKVRLIKKSYAFTHNKVHNILAYLKSALKENYLTIDKEPGQYIAKVVNDQEEDFKKAYADFVSQRIDCAFDDLDDEKQGQLKEAFEDYLQANNNNFVLDKYYSKGFSNRIVKSMFRTFIKEHFANLLPTIETFEHYKQRMVPPKCH